jgi:hypothetical protein
LFQNGISITQQHYTTAIANNTLRSYRPLNYSLWRIIATKGINTDFYHLSTCLEVA